MNETRRPEDSPGHYGAGYGEQVPESVAPRPAPATDADAEDADATAVAPPGTVVDAETRADPGTASGGGEGVGFTADEVTARPPDRPPTENTPASEKAGLIFERS